jgi:hypothetical protein
MKCIEDVSNPIHGISPPLIAKNEPKRSSSAAKFRGYEPPASAAGLPNHEFNGRT